MNIRRRATLIALCLALTARESSGQLLEDAFARVHESVVTIRSMQQEWVSDPEAALVNKTTVGSGVLLSREGAVLTAAHVVDLADNITVEFVDGTIIEAKIVASAPDPDLALLQLIGPLPDGAVIGELGDSDDVRVGSQVFIIGAPLDLNHTLTVGHVSARRKEESFLGSMRFIEHFQTDAAINKGNSGGPMFNMRGEIVGIVCHIVSQSGASEGLGFVVTSNAVRTSFLDRKHIWLGFDSIPLSGELARALNVPGTARGLLVQKVSHNSPAENLGLRGGAIPVSITGRDVLFGGDIILEIQGHAVSTPEGLNQAVEAIGTMEPGQELRLVVLRAGAKVELRGPLDG